MSVSSTSPSSTRITLLASFCFAFFLSSSFIFQKLPFFDLTEPIVLSLSYTLSLFFVCLQLFSKDLISKRKH
ncbi:hypothetical protein CSUI_009408 [Cystoisospora suis]|uniref:Transmembrane protein n=1 Tax=Cystoisospora suis TaxID=483139 RepID=A0A2C6JHK4_9APIC|nr:hypothetical protein CSUI_009408 [Cystoisospora suis]